jgi:hypothetical protein
MKNETWYRGEEAVAAGLADEVVPMPMRGDGTAEPEMRKQFDLTAYGYQGPARPESPKPAPPAAPAQGESTLVISIADVLDEETVARLRAAVQPPAAEPDPVAVVEPEPTAEPEAPAVPEPVAAAERPEAATPADDWAALTAHLTQPEPDPWPGLVAHLTATTSASSAATAA